MTNEPRVRIEYLVDYQLSFYDQNNNYTGSELSPLSNLKDINNQEARLKGKKGFHFSGGSVDCSSKCLLRKTGDRPHLSHGL